MSETGVKDNGGNTRRSQADRRAETHSAVLESACRLFGEKGYANTSLEEIAGDCGLTPRPIYHYFGNKKALFSAVNDVMEARILAAMDVGTESEPGPGIVANWRAFLDLCDDPGFRRIVLIDSPNILGRERWSTGAVMEKASSALNRSEKEEIARLYRSALLNRVIMGAFAEAALMVAESEDLQMAKREAEEIIGMLFSRLPGV